MLAVMDSDGLFLRRVRHRARRAVSVQYCVIDHLAIDLLGSVREKLPRIQSQTETDHVELVIGCVEVAEADADVLGAVIP